MDLEILMDSEVNDEDLYRFQDTPGNPRRGHLTLHPATGTASLEVANG